MTTATAATAVTTATAATAMEAATTAATAEATATAPTATTGTAEATATAPTATAATATAATITALDTVNGTAKLKNGNLFQVLISQINKLCILIGEFILGCLVVTMFRVHKLLLSFSMRMEHYCSWISDCPVTSTYCH
jgi:hypothetical protein